MHFQKREAYVFNVVGDDQSASTKHNGCAKKTSPSYKQFILVSDHFHTVDPHVSFSSCRRNLIKTFQIEGLITLITNILGTKVVQF